jgi:hypothetical protein
MNENEYIAGITRQQYEIQSNNHLKGEISDQEKGGTKVRKVFHQRRDK